MLIKDDRQLFKIFQEQVLFPLIKDISKEIVEIIRQKLRSAEISTTTLQDYTTYSIEKTMNGAISTIYINDEMLQSSESWNNGGNGFNRFMSFDLRTSYEGNTIAWHMINWLEKGTNNLPHANNPPNYRGNQPIEKVEMFEKTYKELKGLLPTMIKIKLNNSGLIIANN